MKKISSDKQESIRQTLYTLLKDVRLTEQEFRELLKIQEDLIKRKLNG